MHGTVWNIKILCYQRCDMKEFETVLLYFRLPLCGSPSCFNSLYLFASTRIGSVLPSEPAFRRVNSQCLLPVFFSCYLICLCLDPADGENT
jgi:hypothetical protein